MARDLDRMAQRIEADALVDRERSVLADQLGVLGGRCPWVQDEQQRTFLEARVNELWGQIGGRKSTPAGPCACRRAAMPLPLICRGHRGAKSSNTEVAFGFGRPKGAYGPQPCCGHVQRSG